MNNETKGNNHYNELVKNSTYTETAQYNGMTANKGKQVLTVTRAVIVNHDATFPNREVVARVLLVGKKGAEYEGFVMQSGRINVMRTYNY